MSFGRKKINIAPDVVVPDADYHVLPTSATEITYNPPLERLYAPAAGPSNPFTGSTLLTDPMPPKHVCCSRQLANCSNGEETWVRAPFSDTPPHVTLTPALCLSPPPLLLRRAPQI